MRKTWSLVGLQPDPEAYVTLDLRHDQHYIYTEH